jgi:hypothetical protein
MTIPDTSTSPSVSDISRRNRRPAVLPVALLAAAILIAPGCPSGTPPPRPPADEALLRAKADEPVRAAVQAAAQAPFAAVAAYRDDAFLHHAAALEEAFIPVLNEFGKAAILRLTSDQVLPLLHDPSLRRLAWVGPERLLARLGPYAEVELLDRYGNGAEGRPMTLLARFRDVPGEAQERQVGASGFRIVTRAGPSWVVSGPTSAVPGLLACDGLLYLEKTDAKEDVSREGAAASAPVPHAETAGTAHDNSAGPGPPSGAERVVPIGKRPPYKVLPPEDSR